MTTKETDVVVIGAGPGGYAAAFHAANLGLNVTLVNQEKTGGGVCLKRGCIPSKALLHLAKLINEAKEAAHMGITFGEPKIDLDKIRGFKEKVVDKLAGGINQLAGARKVPYLNARATFLDSTTLKLEPGEGATDVPDTLKFKHCILAAGSRPTVPAFFDIGDERVMDSTGALELKDIPGRMLVVGGGYIGLEMGCVYAALGSKIDVVEMTPTLLPGADRDLVKPLQKRLEEQFDKIMMETKVTGLKATDKGIVASFEDKNGARDETYDRVLISIGRRPNSENLGLENTRVQIIERGFVSVDKRMATDDPHIFAIGDIAGEPMLAHKASYEAKVAAEAIAGKNTVYDASCIPAVVFTDPEVAWVGLTESEARTHDIAFEIAKFPWAASGRAATLGRQEGMTKLLFDPITERLLGMGMVGVGAGDMIAEGALAIEMAANATDLAQTIHPHPTLSETVMETAEVLHGLATHIMTKKR